MVKKVMLAMVAVLLLTASSVIAADCPIMFNVQPFDPAEFVIKQISNEIGMSSFKTQVDKGKTFVEWKIKTDEDITSVTAMFNSNMRLIGLQFAYTCSLYDNERTDEAKDLVKGTMQEFEDNPNIELADIKEEEDEMVFYYKCTNGKVIYSISTKFYERIVAIFITQTFQR